MPTAHLDKLIRRLPELAVCEASIAEAYAALHTCFKAGGKVLLCGNGGSAADADHWAGELLKGFCRMRPLSAKDRKKLPPYVARRLQGALPAIPLTSFPALTSAFGNDVTPDLAFAQLVSALGRRGDVLVALSTSGNARNVCHAVQTAKARGLRTVALTGASGGRLRGLADLCIRAPARETHRAQEYHLPIYHCLSLMLEDAFFG
ncbi:MAG: SIS domain-containing protein [bacterium]|nr:SIS domain-containing protein [bacterium]MDI1336611.1 SIS domain-containing protein [Lacunisphaera sp.]